MMYVTLLVAGALLGATAVALGLLPSLRKYARSEERLEAEIRARNTELIASNREAAEERARRQALEEKLAALRAETEAEHIRRREEEQLRDERQRTAFRNMANDILEEKSRQFKESNRESLEALLKPFRENIDSFRRRVDEVYDKEAQQRFSLKEEIRRLSEANLRMSEEATNLARALKGDSKVQGDWGEMILDTILDSSHLVRGIHYRTQETLKDASGNNLRPDVILNLPDGKQIVIDSKVSLTAYVAYTESRTPEDSARYVKDHLRSVRAHIDELGGKRYQTLVQSPDFVIMFVPNEPAFLLAMQQEPALWSDAYNKKVIVSSPTNLFALLKLVDDLWKRDNRNRNAIAIATEGANLYDKFVGFADTLTDLGRSIASASDKYDKAIKQLKTGSGNLIRRSEKLRELGVKATKTLPRQMADYDDTEEPARPEE
ncbi:DNA recombination protein RmuC [uncultured Alistipes sp.]|uniref:DNA recombination protein RmuC n=1 Tax=uncultured Alistipes sp. TaxID=538949 RepID=UPI002615ACB6|nr:DNA recombination protein RmuC [uncultured Alistipes sp.]